MKEEEKAARVRLGKKTLTCDSLQDRVPGKPVN